MGTHKSEDQLIAEYKKTLEGKKVCDCEECKGTGLIEKTLGGSGDPEFEVEVFCWDCMGTGKVVQTVTIVDSKGTRTVEVDLAKSFDKFKEVNQLLGDWTFDDDYKSYVFVRDNTVFEQREMTAAEAEYRGGSNAGPETIMGGHWELYSDKHEEYDWINI